MKRSLTILLGALLSSFCALAQPGYIPSEGNLANRERFRDDKFGLFIHWGIYSMMASEALIMDQKNLDYREYAKLAEGFYPSKFNAADWVATAKDAGMKYIVITSRHHDGFSMWGTKQSDFNIVKATPFARDVIRELADECAHQGIRFGLYYSHLDWYHLDYYPRGERGHGVGRPESGDWNNYLAFMNAQLTELLTDYGPINQIWFDGWWDQRYAVDWKLDEQYALIHCLQPDCLIGNNRHIRPSPGEDFQMFEQQLPGHFGQTGNKSRISDLPLESCQTMNNNWGYAIADRDYKSTAELIRYLVRAAGDNANLLLNVGPQPNGEIPASSLERLKEMGVWMRQYGETIYGTRAGSIAPRDWGVTTQKENKLFVHILNLRDTGLYLPLTGQKVKKALALKDGSSVRFTQDKDGVVLHLAEAPTEIDYIVQLEF